MEKALVNGLQFAKFTTKLFYYMVYNMCCNELGEYYHVNFVCVVNIVCPVITLP